ncbi:MAG: restriction endonuclease [Slackia sp.]|nr:restriction endonuclease [Slackia sp.]
MTEFVKDVFWSVFGIDLYLSSEEMLLLSIAFVVVLLGLAAVGCWLIFRLVRSVVRAYMRGRFKKVYDVQCDSTVIIGFRSNQKENSFSLAYPRWRFKNKDGSRDKRRSRNELLLGWCHLGVGSFKVRCLYPEKMLWIVRQLRKRGVSIQLCNLELANVRTARSERQLRTASQIYDSFSSNPSGFEQYCAWLYSAMGYQCETTAKTSDGGLDVRFIDPDGKSGIMECKCYADQSTVSRPLIDKLIGVNAHERADRVVFVTTSQFTSGARKRADEFGVELVDGKALASLVDEYVSCDRSDDDFADVTWQQLAACYPPDVRPSKVYFGSDALK